MISSDPFDGLAQVVINNASLAYEESGEGEPVVLVHGSASDIRTWQNQRDVFDKKYRVIAYSRRYARPNSDIPDGVDDQMLPHVDDLLSLLTVLNANPAHLIGHSWGGFISLLAAIRRPDMIHSLVLMEPPVLSLFVSTPPRPAELVRLLYRRPLILMAILKFGKAATDAQKAFRRGDNDTAMKCLGHAVLGKKTFEHLSEERLNQARDNQETDMAQLLGAGFPPLTDQQVRRVQTPTLLLCSERSPSIFRRLGERLEELLPNAERVTVPNASHIMQEDNPAFVNKTIHEFLDRQPGRTPQS